MASIKIVNYATEDYDEVLPIFKSGAYSPITHAIKNTVLTRKQPALEFNPHYKQHPEINIFF